MSLLEHTFQSSLIAVLHVAMGAFAGRLAGNLLCHLLLNFLHEHHGRAQQRRLNISYMQCLGEVTGPCLKLQYVKLAAPSI